MNSAAWAVSVSGCCVLRHKDMQLLPLLMFKTMRIFEGASVIVPAF